MMALPFGISLGEWGDIMKMARSASSLATEDARKKGLITDPLDSSILLYTDCVCTAHIISSQEDMEKICKTSNIEDVCVSFNSGFPPDAFEAPRIDVKSPRIAAMFFRAIGSKCPRCRNYTKQEGEEICVTCVRQLKEFN